MAAYLRFYDPQELIESMRNYIFAHPKCTIVSTVSMMSQMYEFYVEPEPGEPYEVKTGWTIGAMNIIACPSAKLRGSFLSPEGRDALLRAIREKDFGKKRTRYDLISQDHDLV